MALILLVFRLKGAPRAGWNAAALLILLFCIWNAVAGIWATGIWLYLAQSVALFVLLYPVAVGLASTLSGMSLDEFGAEAMIFVAPVLYYPFLLIIMGVVRLLT